MARGTEFVPDTPDVQQFFASFSLVVPQRGEAFVSENRPRLCPAD